MKKDMSRRDFLKTSARAGLIMTFAGSRVVLGESTSTFDLVIKNGMVIDGIKNEAYRADIGIIGEHIKEVGDLQKAPAKSVLDAAGLTDRLQLFRSL